MLLLPIARLPVQVNRDVMNADGHHKQMTAQAT